MRFLLCVQLCLLYFPASYSLDDAPKGYQQDIPKCPRPCGDNPTVFCPDGHVFRAQESKLVVQLHEGLKENDFWDIRVQSTEQHLSGASKFSVMIMDERNYARWKTKDPAYLHCSDSKYLGEETHCLSLLGDFCKQRKGESGQLHNYTHVVITCEGSVTCPLEWSISAVMMHKSSCKSLGMPCSVTMAIFWIFFLGGIGVLLFIYRAKISDGIARLPPLSSLRCNIFGGEWRIFSGKFNGVEEMEARLAQRTMNLDSGEGGGGVEPYSRL
mmetsp:Transcript_575/g.1117  ORF Transcript_575/g.1117 Transcript_575/m.1117 type:complete len:270 (+) Transcript_575:44-853(+)